MFNISNFKSEILSNGVLRSNSFEVNFAAPKSMANSIKMEKFTLRCENVQIPGVSLATIDNAPRFGYGPIEKNPYNVIFDDIGLTFVVDANGDMHRFFYDWANSIVNFQAKGQSKMNSALGSNSTLKTFEVAFKDDYVTDLNIDVLDSSGRRILSAKVFRAYPINMPSMDMSWGAIDDIIRLPISFSYTDFSVKYYAEKLKTKILQKDKDKSL